MIREWFKDNTVSRRKSIEEKLSEVEVVIMDGCAMQFSLKDCWLKGLIDMSASPSQHIKPMMKAYSSKHQQYFMPALAYDEVIGMATVLEGETKIVKEIYRYMNGIACYLLRRGHATMALHKNIEAVNTRSLLRILTMQKKSKDLNKVAFHALLLWEAKQQQQQQQEGEEIDYYILDRPRTGWFLLMLSG